MGAGHFLMKGRPVSIARFIYLLTYVFDVSLQRMPTQTWLILWTELCERFSYYGIKSKFYAYLTCIAVVNVGYYCSYYKVL